ncbi:hypothetical protein [Streptomyces sp. YKOK-I1]
MAALLVGIAFTHGLSAESVKGHLVIGTVAPAAAAHEDVLDAAGEPAVPSSAAIADPGEEHGLSHPKEYCVSGQPQQAPVLTPPLFAVSVSEQAPAGRASGRPGADGSALSVASSRAPRSSVVQQV